MDKLINLNMEYYNIQANKVVEHINNWKIEFYLKPRKSLSYSFIPNNDENIRWTFKNANKIEFIIKNLTTELEDLLKKEVKKENCSCKITKRKKEQDYLMIIKEKSLCVIS